MLPQAMASVTPPHAPNWPESETACDADEKGASMKSDPGTKSMLLASLMLIENW